MTHAWLFTGPPGSGRSVAARAFAAALQCTPTQPGCGHCAACTRCCTARTPTSRRRAEGLSLSRREVRAVVEHGPRRPTLGRWRVTSSRTPTGMQRATRPTRCSRRVEEPPPRGVLLLCAPGAEDLLPTIRSRCRLVPLRTPRPRRWPRCWCAATASTRRWPPSPRRPRRATSAGPRRLATDEGARRERQDVLALVALARHVGSALAAAAGPGRRRQGRGRRGSPAAATPPRRRSSPTALGAGATGKGLAGGAPRGGAGALKELETRQKRAQHPHPARRPRPGAGRPRRRSTATCSRAARHAVRRSCTATSASRRRRSPGPPRRSRRCGGSTRSRACRDGAGRQRRAAARGGGDGPGAAHRLTLRYRLCAHHAALAQSVEHLTRNEVVVSSILTGGSTRDLQSRSPSGDLLGREVSDRAPAQDGAPARSACTRGS